MLEDCYFWVDPHQENDSQKISVFCQKCGKNKIPKAGWFWEGSKLGYGPFEFICCVCGHEIYNPTKEKNENA